MTTETPILENEHFRLIQVAGGIYAAIATLRGGAMSNAGIVDLGDETIVFDAFLTRAAAAALRAAAVELTGRTPRFLILSHPHGDHVCGSTAFLPEAKIASSSGTRAAMAAEADEEIDRDELASLILQLEETLDGASDERGRLNCEMNLHPRRWLLEELPIEPVIPAIALDGELEIRGSDRTIRLVSTGPAHTCDDLLLVCAKEQTVFLGDLGFFQDSPAYIAPEGSAANWSARLCALEAEDVSCFVPGHGAIGGREELTRQRGFLDAAVAAARDASRAGGTVDDVIERMRESEYARWEETMSFAVSLQSVLIQAEEGR